MQRIKLCDAKSLDIVKTFECGQCFRWNSDENGVYHGVVSGHYAEVENIDGEVYITSDTEGKFWQNYFDLATDYEEISAAFTGEYLEACREFGYGIRILRQDSWEALCSFIISQCNNISRIKGIVEKLCESFGEEIKVGDTVYYSFPTAEKMAQLTIDDLAPLRAGYRAEYIIIAAKAVADGSLDLEALKSVNYKDAIKSLRGLRGIGEKVANCVVLFGLAHMEAFPVDVWMKRALKENFPRNFNPESLGPYAGLAQQYIFYYARSMGK
ncbi:MAG: DNA glycosylase [Bacillota bacterium]|nr:DNA glycosylase [Bacillota bacterium]